MRFGQLPRCDSSARVLDGALHAAGRRKSKIEASKRMSITPQNWASLPIMWSGSYSCMPYMVTLPTGEIISSLTVSETIEGASTQRVIVLRSSDAGRTWAEAGAVEPPSAPENSWGMPWHDRAAGRLYLFYLYNADNVRHVPSNDGLGGTRRVDSIGRICWKVSTDGGMTWGPRRVVPGLPPTAADLRNPFRGRQRLLWQCGHPVAHGGDLYIGFSKIGMVRNNSMFTDTEAFLLRVRLSSLEGEAEAGPEGFAERPAGRQGIRASETEVSEEPSHLVFDDGAINVIFRTTTGQLGEAWSVDGGDTFSIDWARQIDGSILPHPRAKAAQFLLPDGRAFLWFHNNTYPEFGKHRNPVWYSVGERMGPRIRWGPPFALCYDPDPARKITYPSLLVLGDEILIAATDKSIARLMRFPISAL